MFGYTIVKKDNFITEYRVVNRGDYQVIQRVYKNGNVKSDRLGSRRGNSTLRTALHGRYFA